MAMSHVANTFSSTATFSEVWCISYLKIKSRSCFHIGGLNQETSPRECRRGNPSKLSRVKTMIFTLYCDQLIISIL